jgi:hypothetical protein
MKKILLSLLLVSIIACIGSKPASNPEAEKAAIKAAQNWLKLVDTAKYATSWEQAAQYFKKAVPKKQWVKTIKIVREPLGKHISRAVVSKRYCTSLPGIPDGKYVVIQFKSSFNNKKNAIETITPMKDKDGKWRVSGYFIK